MRKSLTVTAVETREPYNWSHVSSDLIGSKGDRINVFRHEKDWCLHDLELSYCNNNFTGSDCSCDPFNLHVKAGISKHVSSKVWPTGRNRNVLAGCICSTGRTVKGGEGEGEVTWNEGKEGRKS